LSDTNISPSIPQIVRVLVVESTRLGSEFIGTFLHHDERFQVLDAILCPTGIRAAVIKEKPSVVLISADIGGNPRRGFQAAREVHALHAGPAIVMLLESSERDPVVEAFRSGARGVFSRSESLRSLARCIHCVSQGQIWANSKELGYLLEAFGQTVAISTIDRRDAVPLSRREGEMLQCVAEGLSNREIAQRLGLSEHTVKNYLFRVSNKLGVSKRVKMARYVYGLAGTVRDESCTEGVDS